MLDILFELAKTKEYASFYNDYESDKFYFGFVLAVNKKEIAFQLFSPDGEEDGILITETENIFQVERKGQYAKKMKKLCSGTAISEWVTPIDEDNIVHSVLKSEAIKEKIVSIELGNGGFFATTGFVEHFEKDQCVIKQVDDYGFEDGFSYVSVSDISKISIDRREEKRILRLWNYNQS